MIMVINTRLPEKLVMISFDHSCDCRLVAFMGICLIITLSLSIVSEIALVLVLSEGSVHWPHVSSCNYP